MEPPLTDEELRAIRGLIARSRRIGPREPAFEEQMARSTAMNEELMRRLQKGKKTKGLTVDGNRRLKGLTVDGD